VTPTTGEMPLQVATQREVSRCVLSHSHLGLSRPPCWTLQAHGVPPDYHTGTMTVRDWVPLIRLTSDLLVGVRACTGALTFSPVDLGALDLVSRFQTLLLTSHLHSAMSLCACWRCQVQNG
jgi:hypothetical protein